MIYNLGDYRFKNGKIYHKRWWFIFKCIDKGPYTYLEGVKQVNTHCARIQREYSLSIMTIAQGIKDKVIRDQSNTQK